MSFFCWGFLVLKTLKSKIKYRISRSTNNVFVVKDFLDFSDADQVGRVLRGLIKQGHLIKIGQGLYVKARISALTGKSVPVLPLPELAREVIKSKSSAKLCFTKDELAYDKNKSTQIPSGRVIGVKGRIQRKISFNGVDIHFEKVA
jgi:hypothetical protein